MPSSPALDEFELQVQDLRRHPLFVSHLDSDDQVRLGELSLADVAVLIKDEGAYYFLIAAAELNRTSLKRAMKDERAQIVEPRLRRAFAVHSRLPRRRSFADVVGRAVTLRRADIDRTSTGSVESLFRERLRAEGIPILMSPPIRQVPGVLIGRRKPDGVYPDPVTDEPPKVYLEIKNVRRVSDDIQKRLYEVAEASLEMKLLYGTLRLRGLAVSRPSDVLSMLPALQARIRAQIVKSRPAVVVLLLCPRAEAERYRAGAETFIDRVFFQEEIDECLTFLRDAVAAP
ncbi:MAG TPA: hypothetical protein VGR62_05150 [Candidatus Binatia bacterium]|jgi:hypothetical protein|nr:hypothetical protein [Candidatus Binatia bacterium]